MSNNGWQCNSRLKKRFFSVRKGVLEKPWKETGSDLGG